MSKNAGKVRMTLYRLTDLSSSLSLGQVIREKYKGGNYKNESISISGKEAELYWGMVEHDRAGWTKTVQDLTGKDLKVGTTTASSVLIIRKEKDSSKDSADIQGRQESESTFSAWAVTFGMGFHMLDQKYIDPEFGKRIVIRSVDAGGLNVLGKTTLDESPQMVNSVIPAGSALRRFGFEELGDLVTKLVAEGKIESTDKPVRIQGADSLNLPLPTDPHDLLSALDRIEHKLFEDPDPEFAVLENLSQIKDKHVKNNLDERLCRAIRNGSNQVAISYPYEIIDYIGQAGAFKITGSGKQKINDFLPSLDDLLESVRDLNNEDILCKLKSMYVQLYENSNDESITFPNTSVKKWLTYQETLDDGKRYFLLNNRWYIMDKKYFNTVQGQVQKIFDRGGYFNDLPNWPIYDLPDKDEQKKRNAERKYNEDLAKHLEGLCLDQRFIRPTGGTSDIEACDVLLPEGVFVHVKHVSASAPASHLLAQAFVSTELLRTDEGAQEQLREKIRDAGGNPDNYDTKPQTVVIVMAKKGGLDASSLFTFTQINLVRHDQRFASMGVNLYVASIERNKKNLS